MFSRPLLQRILIMILADCKRRLNVTVYRQFPGNITFAMTRYAREKIGSGRTSILPRCIRLHFLSFTSLAFVVSQSILPLNTTWMIFPYIYILIFSNTRPFDYNSIDSFLRTFPPSPFFSRLDIERGVCAHSSTNMAVAYLKRLTWVFNLQPECHLAWYSFRQLTRLFLCLTDNLITFLHMHSTSA